MSCYSLSTRDFESCDCILALAYDGDNNVKECNVDKRGLVISLIGGCCEGKGKGEYSI